MYIAAVRFKRAKGGHLYITDKECTSFTSRMTAMQKSRDMATERGLHRPKFVPVVLKEINWIN